MKISLMEARKEFGHYLLDISKLVFAGVVINAFYNNSASYYTALVWAGSIVSIVICFLGILIISKK